MSGHGRRTSLRVALTATALALPFAVSGCASHGTSPAAGAPVAPNGANAPVNVAATVPAPAVPAAPAVQETPAAPKAATAPPPNGTYGTRLTVSNGTSKVLMNGGEVDFGTEVHDLTWSHDGKRAAFIDGDGNLSVADPDGTGRVVVAAHRAGETFSHPTFQFRPDVQAGPIEDNLYFSATKDGVSKLMWVAATAVNGTPQTAPLSLGAGRDVPQVPYTGNVRPSSGGRLGRMAYEHDEGAVAVVYLRDDYLRLGGELAVTDASQPAYFESATSAERDLAFVRSSHGHRHIFVSPSLGWNSTNPRFTDLTPDASVDCSAPVFSPDGAQVAFSTPDQIDIVDVAHPGRVSVVTTAGGVPAFRP